MRRNDVVEVGKPDLYNFYGRIISVRGDQAYVVCCGAHHRWMPVSELRVSDYRGYQDHHTGRFRRMPSLRRLKQMAARYDKAIWKRNHSAGMKE
jgi:hypothetical protein